MNVKNRRWLPVSLSTLLPLLLIGWGWYAVIAQSRSLETSTIRAYQQAQLEIVRSTTRAAQSYMTRELAQRPKDLHAIEQEVLQIYVKPIRVGNLGDAWIYSPNYVIFDESTDFPADYRGKSMALIFAIQRQHGAQHYEQMTQAVMQGREGVGWYVWQPDKARDAAPWWEFLTQDSGREIAAWSPVVVPSSTPNHQKVWVVGLSTLLPELMQTSGAYAQIQTLIVTMGGMTVAALLLLGWLRHSRRALKASEAHYRAIVEDQMEMICRFRCDGSLTFVNQAYADAFGIQPGSLKGINVFDLIPQSELATVLTQLATLSADHPVHAAERLITTDRQYRWQQWIDRAIFNHRGQVVEIQSVGRDITDRKLYEAEIERLAFTDPLTGLANRRRLYDLGHNLLSSPSPPSPHPPTSPTSLPSPTPHPPLGLIYLDLDRFKPINDTLGHDAGDELLIQVAERLRTCLRRDDLLARLGGDEFAILLFDSTLAEAEQVAERILDRLHQPFQLRGHAIQIGTSLGIALAAADLPFSQLLTQADIAMYRAKTQGRGSYVIFDGAMAAEILTRRELEADLQQVIGRNQLRVYYQPIVALASCQILGFEAVVRWHHPRRGLLSPAEFLPVAADLGCHLPIERWVMQQACDQVACWQTQFPNLRLMLSVNLSGKHLAQPDLVESLSGLLRQTGLLPTNLMLETTEAYLIEQTELALASLHRLQRLGVKIALDDFGTGYASLSYLHRFPVDVLKIDHSFVQTIRAGEDRASSGGGASEVARSIIMLAQSRGIGTIAEGIETTAQLTQLRRLRCQAGQGYLFAEPLSGLSAEAFLKSYNYERLRVRSWRQN
ncbi:MAG: putative bifunctional diguanylate cyclase/phosphodiesterase [Elainella sp.]